jgi:hypothetical protein
MTTNQNQSTLSRIYSINSDDHQFYQYQQNEQSRLILTEHKKGPRHMRLENRVVVWDRHKHVAGLNQLMGINRLLLITGSPTTIHI